MNLLSEAAIFLAAAVVTVPLFRRFKLSAVLGYLAAGVLIGPFGLKFVSAVDNVMHFAELGVVLLLFIIGLELQPSRLWVLRKQVFGLGALQVLGTGLALAAGSVGLVVLAGWLPSAGMWISVSKSYATPSPPSKPKVSPPRSLPSRPIAAAS